MSVFISLQAYVSAKDFGPEEMAELLTEFCDRSGYDITRKVQATADAMTNEAAYHLYEALRHRMTDEE